MVVSGDKGFPVLSHPASHDRVATVPEIREKSGKVKMAKIVRGSEKKREVREFKQPIQM